MSTSEYILFSLLLSLIDILIFYRLLNNKLEYRFTPHTRIIAYIVSYILMLLTSNAADFFPGIPLKLVFLLLFFVSLFIIYKDSIFKRILWITVTYFSTIVCELITLPFVLICSKTNFNNLTNNLNIQIIGTLCARLFLIIIIELLIRTKKKMFSEFSKDFFSILLVDAIYASIIFSLFYYNNVYLTTDVAISLSVFAIFIISALALYLLRKITNKSDEIMMTNLKMQQIEMEHKQNQDMAIVVDDLRALRHDMNNHMSVLQGLLTMHAYDDAQSYLSNITEELSVANSFIFTDNKVLSVMLNNKISKARQLGITFDTELLTSITPFSDSDLCAVVGNILENAIEASSKHINPYILFSMKKLNENLIIECENNYTVAPIFEKGNLITTKSDKAYHGIGTKTIRSVVDEYHGTTEFAVNDMFLIKVVVPI